MKVIAPALALAATVFGFTAPASADTRQTAYADIDGDGRRDRVAVQTVDGQPDEQLLTARVRGHRLSASVPLASYNGVQPMRVTDVDVDGRDEVVVTESVGANTDSFGVWGLRGNALAPVTLADGTPLRLWDGGGISAISRYGCTDDHEGRKLVQVNAVATGVDFTVYTGETVVYVVEDGVATETARIPVSGPRDAPEFQLDPALCA